MSLGHAPAGSVSTGASGGAALAVFGGTIGAIGVVVSSEPPPEQPARTSVRAKRERIGATEWHFLACAFDPGPEPGASPASIPRDVRIPRRESAARALPRD